MGGVVDSFTSAIGGLIPGFNKKQSDRAEDAARSAAQAQLQAQREALDYLREREALPQQYREGALGILGGLYGLGSAGGGGQANIPPRPEYTPSGQGGIVGGLIDQINRKKYEQDLAEWESQYGGAQQGGGPGGMSRSSAIEALQSNPLYQAALGDIPAQEEAILRSQAATGALRSSGSEQMLAENQRRNQMQAYQAALSPLQGLAGLQSYAPQIAQGMAGLGQTQAQGIIGAEQSRQAAQQAGFGNMMGLGQLGLAAFSAFCDPLLKDDVVKVGELDGYNIYRWTWNDEANKLGLFGEGVGPMADEIEAVEPERVEMRSGYKFVRPAQ